MQTINIEKFLSILGFRVTFSTVNAISTNFHVKCLVEKLKSPLNLLVGAAAVSVKATVSFVSKNGEMVYLGEDRVNVIYMCPVSDSQFMDNNNCDWKTFWGMLSFLLM